MVDGVGEREAEVEGARARFVRRTLPLRCELAHLPAFIRDYAGDSYALFLVYGDVFHRRIGPASVFVFHPILVRHVLRTNVRNYVKGEDYTFLHPLVGDGVLVSEGELWTRQRRLLAPEFRASAVARFAPVFQAELERECSTWAEPIARGQPLDLGARMMRLTLLSIGGAMFQSDFARVAPIIVESIETLLGYTTLQMITRGALPPWLPLPINRRAKDAERRLDAVVSDLIEAGHGSRSRSGCPSAAAGVDVVSRMLLAEDKQTGAKMSRAQLRDEVKTLIFAGYETSGVALGWVLYMLDRHPEVRARVVDELDAVLDGSETVSVEQVERLPYLRQVLLETMRLYPPVPAVSRMAVADDEIAGVAIHAGENVTIQPYVVHRHPEFWPDPERFDPERFAPGQLERIEPYSYIPFLRGRRACLGEHFAMLEMMMILATIYARYRLERVDSEPIGVRPMSTLCMSAPLRMRVWPRA